ncbi:MAG: AI-2E family transporter [Desulfovibrionaceae bacterium]|nr:AI-2E family transporter [Desulfovibrionaceae bacterium]
MSRILALCAMTAWILLLIPYPITTFMAACIACVTYPFYQKCTSWLSPRIGMMAYASSIGFAVMLPIVVIVSLVTPQALAGLRTLDALRTSEWMHGVRAQTLYHNVDTALKKIPGFDGGLEQLAGNITDLIGSLTRQILAGGVGFFGGAFQAVVVVCLFVLLCLLFANYASTFKKFTCRITSLPEDVVSRYVTAFRKAIFGVLIGVVFVAMIQGFLCGLGFSVAGVPQAAFWGLLAACVAPIPFIGTTLVWIPICIWLWIKSTLLATIGLALWCAIVVSGVDNFLRPFFLKTGIDASVLVLVLAIICGLAAFGPVGIFVGPLLVAFAVQSARESDTFTKANQNSEKKE